MRFRSLFTYGRLIAFSHTIFALPFALASVVLAAQTHPFSWGKLLWIVIAMAGARSAAMGFNRYADRRYDRRNPRTVSRPSVTGEIGSRSLLLFVGASSAVFVGSAAMLNRLCLWLAVPCLAVLFFYSYTKRFTVFSHLFLGFAIGLAPVGAWIAWTGGLDPRILPLSLALMTYIAGFDILYACQDVDFDRRAGLHSIPSRWGIPAALLVSSALHGATFLLLLALQPLFQLGRIYTALLVVIGALLLLEHLLVRPSRLDKIPVAFFHVNSAVSVLLILAIFLDRAFV